MRIEYDPESFRKGRAAGMKGDPSKCPRDVPDGLAWISGDIEGKALRE